MPAGQLEQEAAPAAAYLPGGHGEQAGAPALENFPATQEMHMDALLAPTAELAVPAAQAWHASAELLLEEGLYLPARQSVQLAAAVTAYFPGAQGEQEFPLPLCPAAQLLQ